MKKLRKWTSHEFSSLPYAGEDFKKFAREFNAEFKKSLAQYGVEVIRNKPGHYYLSGFVKNPDNGKFAYYTVGDVRYMFGRWAEEVLIRTAKSEKDFTGGFNQYSTLEDLPKALAALVQ